MNHFNTQWHGQSVAIEWPKGSVVLMRCNDRGSKIHNHSYVLSLFFAPASVSGGEFQEWEFQLVEERKQQ